MNEERLEALLSVYRYRGAMPDFRGVTPIRRRVVWPWLAGAAAAILIAIVAIRQQPRPSEWRATSVLGNTRVPRVLRAGDVVATDAASRVRLEAPTVGIIDVGERTTLRLVESRKGRQRLALASGTIHAKTKSPPGVFVIDTPRARAIDLGCEYLLSVSPDGNGILRVSLGWVELMRDWAQTLVPQGGAAAIASDGRITAPYFEDASPAFQQAVRRYSFGSAEDLQTILTLARRRDAITLLNLFRFATAEERLRIYDRLNALVPAPPTVPRDAMRNWTITTSEAWWPDVLKASGVNAIKKKKGMLRGL